LDLKTNTLFTGKVCIYLELVGSTQQYLLELIAKSKPIEGTAILSYNQTQGQGQRGNQWHMQAGENIAISIIFYPAFLKHSQQYHFNMAMALAVRDCVAAFVSQRVFIKWPNDIIVENKKVGGILINASTRQHSIEYLVSGIGLNVNQKHFPADLPDATSMAILSGKNFEKEDIVAALLAYIEARYLQLKAGRSTMILDSYRAYLFKKDTMIHYRDEKGDRCKGIITGVNNSGELEVKKLSGESIEYKHGKIEIMDWYD